MSCDRSEHYHFNLFNLDVPSCSNHGDCMLDKCYCHSDWTSIGDYELNPYFDCDINIPAIRSLCIITLILFFFNSITLFRGLSRMKFSWIHIGYDAKLTVFICFAMDIFGHSISAVAKAIDPTKYVIGAPNGIVNVGNNIFMIFCGLGWCYYYQIFTSFIQGYSKMVDKEYRDVIIEKSLIVDNFIIYCMVFPVICVICDDLCLLFPSKADSFAIGNLQGLLFTAGALMIASEMSISIFINEIGKFLASSTDKSNEQIRYIHSNTKILRYAVAIFLTFSVFTCGIFSAWDYLRRKITYLHQVLHITIAIVEGCLAYVLMPKTTYIATKRKKSSISISVVVRKSISGKRAKKSVNSIQVTANNSNMLSVSNNTLERNKIEVESKHAYANMITIKENVVEKSISSNSNSISNHKKEKKVVKIIQVKSNNNSISLNNKIVPVTS